MQKITPRYLAMFPVGAMSVSVGMPMCVIVGVGLSLAMPVVRPLGGLLRADQRLRVRSKQPR
jgi:hypothetical protein